MNQVRTVILLIFICWNGILRSQTETPDSIIALPIPVNPQIENPEWIQPDPAENTASQSVMKRDHSTPIFRVPQLRYSYIPYGQIASWGTGGVSAAMSSSSMPGLMGVESGSLWLHQSTGPFTVAMSAEAIKYGYFRGLETQYGFSGSLSYEINEQLSLTMFGSYYTSPHGFMTPAAMGYLAISSAGGFLDWRINDRWGIKVGAQGYRSPITRHWEIQPMAIPYFRLNRKTEIGIDVGGILYQLIRSKSNIHTNPTIPPPIP